MLEISIRDLDTVMNETPCAVALGNFDGVHIGHATLLAAVTHSPYRRAVFTFAGEVNHFLTDEEERKALIADKGIRLFFSAPFPLFQALSPFAFVHYLWEKLAVRHIVCGYNFRFGKNAEGTPELLKSLAAAYSVTVEILPEKKHGDTSVSSSRIRALLAAGHIEEATLLLGHPFSIRGNVNRGYSIGNKLECPTLNLSLPDGIAPIPQGVYVSRTVLDGRSYPSVTNIGNNPTFERQTVTCETHLLETSGDFYGKKASVQLLSFLRGERRFASFEELKEAIARDVANAKAYHGIAVKGED